MDSILVATWGNPWIPGWREVEYILNDERVMSKCSLSSLLCRIKKEEKELSKILIIVLDTVADRYVSTYEELLGYVKGKFLDFVRKDLGLDTRNIEIIVAPGTGRFRTSRTEGLQIGEFLGDLLDFYIYVLLKLSKELNPGELSLHLDLSHGINYMPVLVYRAIKELLGILAIGSDIVTLKVYNAEPFVGEVTTSLRIHSVENTSVAPSPCSEALNDNAKFLKISEIATNPKLASEKLSELDSRKLDNEVDSCLKDLSIKELNAFLGAVLNGLPLTLYSFFPDHKKLEEYLNCLENIYRKWIEIYRTENGFRVVRKVSFENDFATLIKCYFTAKVFGLDNKKIVSLRDLHDVRRKFFFKNRRLDIMISNSLHEIEEKVKNMIEKDEACRDQLASWISLSEIFERKKPDMNRFDDRNFLAHSGFERNVTYMKLSTEGKDKYNLREHLLVKYSEEREAQKRILDSSSKGLTFQ